MKLLVMGAGYVGKALLKHLQIRNYELFITTTSVDKLESLGVYSQNIHLITPNDHNVLKDLINTCDGMIVMVAPTNGSSYEETYLKTSKLISSFLHNRTAPFYLIYTGSTSVYDGQTSGWAMEDWPLTPISTNAKTLLSTENELLNYPNTCILRLSGIYGPDRELPERAKRFSGIDMPDDGNQLTNHIHLDDIVSAICFCLDKRLKGTYNLSNEDHPTRNQLYAELCQSMKIPPPQWNPKVVCKSSYKVSNHKIKSAGFNFKHPHLSIN